MAGTSQDKPSHAGVSQAGVIGVASLANCGVRPFSRKGWPV
jgi:hypothetical protein